ncbi:MAG TPA: alpha-amylase family glycosyl hydrolase [Candidatus Wallbacteria bacterium]|nr:alpha-amylase family glycosyl hydrolase [Candidatus Wallbacteria bacterium]
MNFFKKITLIILVSFISFYQSGAVLAANRNYIKGKSSYSSICVTGSFNNWAVPSVSGALKNTGGTFWESQISLPVGKIEYKFVANGSWAVNFGDKDCGPNLPQLGMAKINGPNITVEIKKTGSYTFTFDEKHFSYSVKPFADANVPLPGPAAPLPPPANNTGADFREETIYFAITTRFFDGDVSNNYYNRDRIKIGDPQWRGDFKGLAQKLDYIKDLGFTAIWITPPVENRSGLDYHGYHAYDWTRIDPRLESADFKYKDFIKACHDKGIKVIQDVVVNHSCNYGIRGKVFIDRLPLKYFRKTGIKFSWPYENNLGDYRSEFREDNDNPVAPEWFRERQNSDPAGVTALVDPKTGATVPKENYDANRFFGTDAAGLDPKWYHLNGFIAGGDWENPVALQTKHMAGDTIDLATGNQNVKDYINGAIKTYLEMGVDAIRVDTVKHIDREELLSYVNEWKKIKPSVFVFGEALVKGLGYGDLGGDNAPSAIRPWWYTRTGMDPKNPDSGGDSGLSVLDFSLFSTFRDNVSRGNFNGIGGVFGMDWIYGDATRLVTFFQNHDVGPDNDFKYRFGGESWMAALAYNLMWTARGIPCLYYGEETEFMKGAPQDICGEKDTLDTTGRAYFGDYLTPEAILKTKSHALYRHIKRLNLMRRSIPALQKAVMSNVSEWGAGMSFVRDYNNGESYAVVGLAAGGSQDITVSGVRNGVYRDAVTGNSATVSNGAISFNVKGASAGIWVLNGPGKIGEDGDFLK